MNNLPADLPDAARAYLDALPPGRIVGFPLTSLDRTGVPAWKVALFLADDTRMPGNMPSGYGYGTTDGAAIVGALAEIAEAICPTLKLMQAPVRQGSYQTLAAEVGVTRIVDPLTLCLPAGSPVGHDTSLAWTETIRARTGETVLVPLDVAATDVFELPSGYRPFTTLITNGLGAGPDLDWAVGHGLLECLQRDGNGLLFRALDRGVLLDFNESDLDADTRALLAHIEGCGITVLPKFATDEFGLANIYVVGFDREGHGPRVPIMLSACGEACDPDRNRALHKALLEFCSARVRKTYGHGPLTEAMRIAPPGYVQDFVSRALPSLQGEESRALRAMMDWAEDDGAIRSALEPTVFAVRDHKAFAELPARPLPDTRARGAFAQQRLEEAGFDVLFLDGSPLGNGVGVAKVIVPGLEVETMSYGRIGERNTRKLIERDSPLIRFGEETASRRPVRLAAAAKDRLNSLTSGRQPLFDMAEAERIVGPLYPLYREPEAHHVAMRLGQIKTEETL